MNNSFLKEIGISKHFTARKSCKIDIIEKISYKRHLAIFVDFSRFTVYPARKSKEKSKSEFSVTSPFSQSQKNGFTSISQIGFCQPLSKFFLLLPYVYCRDFWHLFCTRSLVI